MPDTHTEHNRTANIGMLGTGFVIGLILVGFSAYQYYWYFSAKGAGYAPRLDTTFFVIYLGMFAVGVFLIYGSFIKGIKSH